MSTFRIPTPRFRKPSRALKRAAVLAAGAGLLTTGLLATPASAAMGDNVVHGPAACAFSEDRAPVALGDAGDQVSQIQCLLANRQYLGWNQLSGAFDAGTLSAVAHFQADHGLVPDGVVSPATWEALYKAGPPAGPVQSPNQPADPNNQPGA
ncbi:peptidoglycan-binding protein [Streptomyces sp. Ru73]|uniref:peptidoglycan-binding domain-containing protein n=1 Tax=Streptomyces sp. Ru73 TaxID=2080748 RepID=UPI0021565C9F|nr:peptidoglycan-binding protein [Streptomyces sp. Ru73]